MPTLASFDSRERILGHGALVIVGATICGFVAYAASEFYAGIFKLRDVDSRKNAEDAFYYFGGLGIVVALIHLTIT